MRKLHLFILIVFFVGSSVVSDARHFRRLSTSDGLPENTGQALIQDQQGFVWIGTQNGLARYDGHDFKLFQNQVTDKNSLSDNVVEGLLEDHEGYIWIATRNGLNRLDPHTDSITHFFPDTSSAYGLNFIFGRMAEDATGSIWFANSTYLYRIGDDHKITIHSKFDQEKNAFSGISIQQNSIYVFHGHSVYRVQGGTLVHQVTLPADIKCMNWVEDVPYIGTDVGLFNIDGEPVLEEVATNRFILYVNRDRSGTTWIGTTTGLIEYRASDDYVIHRHNPRTDFSISHNLQLSFLEDHEGLLWFGTGQGINIYDKRTDQFQRISAGSEYNAFDLSSYNISSLTYNSALNQLYVGSINGLDIVSLGSDQFIQPNRTYPVSSVLRNEHIVFLYTDQNQSTWISTETGDIWVVTSDHTIPFLFVQAGPVEGIRGMIRQSNDSLWIAGSNGLFLMDVAQRTISKPEPLRDINYSVRLVPFNNKMLLSHRDFTLIIDPKDYSIDTIQRQPGNPTSLSHNMVTDVLRLNNETWLSTFGGGISISSDQLLTFKTISKQEGLENGAVWCLYLDQLNRIWSSTDGGISCTDPKTKTAIMFGTQDGVNFDDFNMLAHTAVGDQLVFGNPQGLTCFNPQQVTHRISEGPFRITDLRVNYKKQVIDSETPRIDIQPGDKSLAISYAQLSYSSNATRQYAYKLVGFDSSWHEGDASSRKLSFTSLPSGEYSLMVKASSGNGNWTDPQELLFIHVIPPFHQTWPFYALLMLGSILLSALVIWLVWRSRQRKILVQMRTQQAVTQERDRIARDLHDHLGANLTKIVSDIDIIEMTNHQKLDESVREQLGHTRDFAHDTIQDLRETLWTLDSQVLTLASFGSRIRAYLEKYLGRQLSWKFKEEYQQADVVIPPIVALHLHRIIQETTQNMVKHSQASQYSVFLKQTTGRLQLVVTDNGRGFESGNTNGYGLRNMEERIRELDGDLEITSQNGVTVRVVVPL